MFGVSRAHHKPAVIQSSRWLVPHPATLEASQTHLQAPAGLPPRLSDFGSRQNPAADHPAPTQVNKPRAASPPT
ncbi:unnamed protein product [Rangifer tarandus platyrhynchus]|uniref:Uncharacterized protein n=2 Tax=Rangifer tarandus platyrhynchus TaxID=3082113 RepID=A0ABN9A2G9_RANTA|nr:unnamed protein product [Rangifer tarandus platyrhynchus]CAI9712433.1 unnamed protein product [Rangifer tarandus platyrhynchus]